MRARYVLASGNITERLALTFAELSVHLSPQDVEQVCRGSHVSNLHVTILVLTVEFLWAWEDTGILVTELEVSLHTSGRMLRSLAIISMRQ